MSCKYFPICHDIIVSPNPAASFVSPFHFQAGYLGLDYGVRCPTQARISLYTSFLLISFSISCLVSR